MKHLILQDNVLRIHEVKKIFTKGPLLEGFHPISVHFPMILILRVRVASSPSANNASLNSHRAVIVLIIGMFPQNYLVRCVKLRACLAIVVLRVPDFWFNLVPQYGTYCNTIY